MRLLLNRKNDMQGIKNLTHGPINPPTFQSGDAYYGNVVYTDGIQPYRHGMGRTTGQ